jgi:hypothetical protein
MLKFNDSDDVLELLYNNDVFKKRLNDGIICENPGTVFIQENKQQYFTLFGLFGSPPKSRYVTLDLWKGSYCMNISDNTFINYEPTTAQKELDVFDLDKEEFKNLLNFLCECDGEYNDFFIYTCIVGGNKTNDNDYEEINGDFSYDDDMGIEYTFVNLDQ